MSKVQFAMKERWNHRASTRKMAEIVKKGSPRGRCDVTTVVEIIEPEIVKVSVIRVRI
jgi:hypothetical protein